MKWVRYGLRVLVVLVGLMVAPQGQAEEPRARALLKLGLEHDSNARRVIGSESNTDKLLRLFANLGWDWRAEIGKVELKALLGAKRFQEIDDEDNILLSTRLSWLSPGLTSPIGSWRVSLSGDFGDRSERVSQRDYLRGGGALGLLWSYDWLSLSVQGGYRGFIYKPDLSSNHEGPTLATSVSAKLWEGLSASIGYRWFRRDFSSVRFVSQNSLIALDPEGGERRDHLHALSLGFYVRRAWLLDLSYSLQANLSNSVGPGLLSHTGTLRWTQPLWWDWLFHLSLRLQRTDYDDPIRIDETLAIDDENRNQLQAGLSVPLWEALALEGKYTLFVEGLTDNKDFTRHLVYLGLSADIDAF